MASVRRTRVGLRVGAVALAAALLWAVGAGVASAAESTQVIDPSAPVVAVSCSPCHGNISDTKLPNVRFKHAAHIVYDCVACQSVFPHQPEGTSIPDMKVCWNCHALRHGPQGQMAEAQCAKCHIKTDGLRPADHTKDWAKTPHVKPGEEQLSTRCMMCHDEMSCEDCHLAEAVIWVPKKGAYAFDPGDGCLACHGSELPRLENPVSGLDEPAHRDNTCPQCHPDFKYLDTPNATKLWDVNAGKSCEASHNDRANGKTPPGRRTGAGRPATAKGWRGGSGSWRRRGRATGIWCCRKPTG